MIIFCSIKNPNRDFSFHSPNYTPSALEAAPRGRINLFRDITQRASMAKHGGPTPGMEAFPVVGPRYGLSQ
jgi:hypothetical protein